MTPEKWQKMESIFQLAMDLPSDERTEFVRRECQDDDDLRAEIEKLIPGAGTGKDFLESPAWMDNLLLESELRNGIINSLEDENRATVDRLFTGRQIGVFRLTEEIGRGGMGVVYLAERADGEFYQKVAIKLIKRGMDTDFILRRFRQERQIAATLNHPNIARLLDGGTTEDNLPYFVMEYVEGSALFDYIVSQKLDLRDKLELFLKICAAVSYAHKKLIIHRDIKPGNILVGEDGEPKLLDFGIAKILDPDLIHESLMPTATQMRLMMPECASPEQVRGEEVTEASDQYSLGVLLYELLTGERPYKFPSRAPHEIARVICEELPSEPSSGAFGKSSLKKADASAAFDADYCKQLDRVVLKALRKMPSERYASVKEFARDIERFLNRETIHAEIYSAQKTDEKAASFQNQITAGQQAIAVLPFRFLNRAADEQTNGDFLGIGLADALITRLSNVRQFVVRPTSSVLRFEDSSIDSFRAGRELSVEFILEGSILKVGSRIRVSVQLLSVAGDSTVWAERFDEQTTNFLDVEDSISANIVKILVPHLTGEERRQIEKRGTENAKAYEAYLRGRYYRNMFSEAGLRKAFAAYQEALSHDPNYAQAYAEIADYYILLGVYGALPPRECHPPAKQAALRAIELDRNLGEAYASLAFVLVCDYDWIAAEKNAVRSVELSPHYAVARLWYSHVLIALGRTDEGIVQAKLAVELDPLTYINYLVLALNYYFARRFEEAVAQVNDNVDNFPDNAAALHNQSWILRHVGKTAEAVAAARRAVELSGGSVFMLLIYAQALAAADQREEAAEALQRVFEESEDQYVSYYQVAIVYVYLKENAKAIDALERAFADREGWLIWLGVEPALDPLRDEPRFHELLKKINYPILRTVHEPDSS
jgi:serine/threonine protein kinase/tetratricopeptide (TPR) repeat protein